MYKYGGGARASEKKRERASEREREGVCVRKSKRE